MQEFLARLPAADAPAPLGAQAAELDEVIAGLSSNSVNQEAGRHFVSVHSESARALRRVLYAAWCLSGRRPGTRRSPASRTAARCVDR